MLFSSVWNTHTLILSFRPNFKWCIEILEMKYCMLKKKKKPGQILYFKKQYASEGEETAVSFFHISTRQASTYNLTKCNMIQYSFVYSACNYYEHLSWMSHCNHHCGGYKGKKGPSLPPSSLQHLWGNKTSMKGLLTEWTANSRTQITVLQEGMREWSREGCREAVWLGLALKNE